MVGYLDKNQRIGCIMIGFISAFGVVLVLFNFRILTVDWLFKSYYNFLFLFVILLFITCIVTYFVQKGLKKLNL